MIKTYKNYKELYLPNLKQEENHGESETNKAGYIPLHIRVKEMQLAGERLANIQNSMFYDIKADEIKYISPMGDIYHRVDGKMVKVDLEIDPSRDPGFGLDQVGENIARLQLTEELYYKKLEEEKKKASQDPPKPPNQDKEPDPDTEPSPEE